MKDQHEKAEKIRQKLISAFTDRATTARDKAIAAFAETGAPQLFLDADLVLKELTGIHQYVLDGCLKGIPTLRPFTISLIKRMLTIPAAFQFDAWVIKEGLTDEEILAFGPFRNDDEYLANFCFAQGDGIAIECHQEHTAQRKILRALGKYVRASAVYAKEIGAAKSAEDWLRAFDIIVRYDERRGSAPYSPVAIERTFAYIAKASSELYVAWMYPQLPTLEELRKEKES